MWNLLSKSKKECERFRDGLETSAGAATGLESVEGLLAMLPVAQGGHAAGCADCRTAADEFLRIRVFLRQASTKPQGLENPWFAGRVMAAIAAREAELEGPAGTWIALPRLASRLALAACAVLLVGSTWLYQRPSKTPGNQSMASAAPEYLFEAPAVPATQDDVLVSLAENNK